MHESVIFKKLILIPVCLIIFQKSIAWGPAGHGIVADIAFRLINDSVKSRVQRFLGKTSFEDAANWMDSMRSNPDYDFMKPWHYLEFEQGKFYSRPPTDDNIVTRLSLAYNELKHYKLLCNAQVKNDLLYIFHLTGDLHQPLHCGYAKDKGGNTITVDFKRMHTNLHKVWDELIISNESVSPESCLQYLSSLSASQLQAIKSINFVSWYNESRSLLEGVYDYPEFIISDAYIVKNKVVIQKQLLYAGIRLAAILDDLFATTEPASEPPPLPGSVTASAAQNFIDKQVTVCAKVYSVKTLDNVSFIDVGAPYPKTPLTLVVFKKDRAAFISSLEDLYMGKYISVKGTVTLYHGKPEIIINSPSDIVIRK